MPSRDIAVALCAEGPVLAAVCGRLYPAVPCRLLTREGLRPRTPFAGPLFELLAGVRRGSCVGLVVPARRVTRSAAAGARGPWEAPAPSPPDALLPVADHVNLELRGPLTGRWPTGMPRDFPQVAGIYQPAVVRASGGARVYSSGVVVAGVADARRLTPFEAQAVAELGVIAVSDVLVPAAIVAAYYGLTLAACAVPQADGNDEQ